MNCGGSLSRLSFAFRSFTFSAHSRKFKSYQALSIFARIMVANASRLSFKIFISFGVRGLALYSQR